MQYQVFQHPLYLFPEKAEQCLSDFILLAREDVEAVTLATPVDTHYELAKKALLGAKHVWVEKPMAETSAQCVELVALAAEIGVLLLVDHTFIYTAPVRKL